MTYQKSGSVPPATKYVRVAISASIPSSKYQRTSISPSPTKYQTVVQANTPDPQPFAAHPFRNLPHAKYGYRKRGRKPKWVPRAITAEDLSRGWAFINKWGPKIATRDCIRAIYATGKEGAYVKNVL